MGDMLEGCQDILCERAYSRHGNPFPLLPMVSLSDR